MTVLKGEKVKKGQIISADDAKSYYDWIGLVAKDI